MQRPFLDCTGLPCPEPVLKVKERLSQAPVPRLLVLVDSEASKENVCRFLTAKGYQVAIQGDGADGAWLLNAVSSTTENSVPQEEQTSQAHSQPTPDEEEQRIIVLLTSNLLGTGDETLGGKLMVNFLATLPEMGTELWRLILLNSGVLLAMEDSPALKALQTLQEQGVSILVCGTCQDFYSPMGKALVGETTNMLDVVTSLQVATKVIRP